MPLCHNPILVVDDNAANRELLRRRLARAGYEVEEACDGEEALKMIEAREYSLVLLDLMMPKVSGQEVLVEVRQRLSLTALPIIVATALHDGATIAETLELGANDYVTKPLRVKEVMARVKTQLRIRELSTSGGFHRLGLKPKQRACETDLYCPRCIHAIFFDEPQCGCCQRLRPASGWATKRLTRYAHLGRVLQDRYVVERYIDQGSTGEVYAVRDLDLGRMFAAKVIDTASGKRDDTQAFDLRERTHREVEAMIKVRNPYVVKPHEVIALGGGTYAILMDHVHGIALHRVLAQVGKLRPMVALEMTRHISQGLHEVHQLGMVHRDIKPANIMLEKLPAGGYFTHILDFGLVHILAEASAGPRAVFCGTPTYAAPELGQGEEKASVQSDIYSLGVLLFHALTGHPPFEAHDIQLLLEQHKRAVIPSAEAELEDTAYGGKLDALLHAMLAKRPEARPTSLLDVLAKIEHVMGAI